MKRSRSEALALLLVLLLAGVARMARPGLTEFKADEARLLTLALDTAAGDVAARGIATSVGFPNAPLSVWLYALPLLVWRHPFAPTLFVGLLNTLAVAGVYWLGRRYWGGTAGLAAALLFAAGPWGIIFSRKLWAQNLLPLFAVGWAACAALALVEGRRWFLALHLLCLAVAVQIHPAAVGLAPATLALLVIFRRRVAWRAVALGVLLAGLTAAPFLWYLWGRWRAEGGLPLGAGAGAGGPSPEALWLVLRLVAGEGIGGLAGEGFVGLPGMVAVHGLWVGLLAGGGVWLAGQTLSPALSQGERETSPALREGGGVILLLWLLAPLLTFVWGWTPVYIHYFIAVLPAAYLIAGAGFARLLAGWGPAARATAWTALALSAALQLVAWGGVMADVAAAPADSAFGVPLATKLLAAGRARGLLRQTGAAEVVIAGDGSNPAQDDFAAEFEALLHDTPRRFAHLNREALFPAAPAVVLLDTAAADGPAATRDLYRAAAAGAERVPVAGSALAYEALALPGGAAPQPDAALDPPPLLANFVRLTGHAARWGPAGLLWDVQWRTADNPDPADYHFFNHLLDGAGARAAQADAAAFSAAQWRAGDVVVSRFLLPGAAGAAPPLTMRVGMYRFPSLEAVPVLDAAANPVGDAIEVGVE